MDTHSRTSSEQSGRQASIERAREVLRAPLASTDVPVRMTCEQLARVVLELASALAEAERRLANETDALEAFRNERDWLDTRLGEAERQRDEALREDPSKWSFDALLTIAELILSTDYPPHVFTGVSGDPGPRFVVALRAAVAECRAALADPPKEKT